MRYVVATCVLALTVTGVALGAIKERSPKQKIEVTQVTEAEAKRVGKLPRLVLPNIKALVKQAWRLERDDLRSQQRKSAQVLAFFDGRGKWLLATRHEKCSQVPWQRSCTIARATHRLHSALGTVATRRLLYEIPITANWTRAMRYAQRAFPGTYDWLASISNRECRACYTTSAFVCNYQGSGACGPMQFMEGTFYGYADDAKAYLDSHGFITHPNTWTWSSQLGQALTAAYMRYTNQDGCHWCL